MIRAAAIACMVALGLAPGARAADDPEVSILQYGDLEGWAADDHDVALHVFLDTCADLDDPEWRPICTLAARQKNARTFFELFFVPVLIENGDPGLFTAYYEPELAGSRYQTARFRYPVYARPPELAQGTRWYSRQQIENEGLLQGRGLEIAWVDDPVALQFLQIQGSGRIRLPGGASLRLGYAGSNGHRFKSLGDELVRRGVYNRHQVSAAVISAWVRRHPEAGRDLLHHNPSFVFFRKLRDIPAHKGPLGAMNRSITAMRTLAVDPRYTPLGAPVWVEKLGENPLHRLMIAQDTGSRIKGPQRADIFMGTGEEAGREAGKISDPGRMVVLLPIQRAYALAPGG